MCRNCSIISLFGKASQVKVDLFGEREDKALHRNPLPSSPQPKIVNHSRLKCLKFKSDQELEQVNEHFRISLLSS